MKLLLLLGLAFAVASADDQCAWGESYWCKSVQNAKNCGAFQHCLTTVWKNQNTQQDGSEVCSYCMNIVKDVRNFITNQQTQDQIKEFMESGCSIIPDADMAKECKMMVDTYFPEVMALMSASIDPQMVCTLLGLCKGLQDTVPHHPIMPTIHRVPLIKVPQAQAEPICGDCKKFMSDIKAQVTSATTEKELEQLLEQNLCAMMGALADECKSLVEAYVPELLELLTSEFDPAQVCEVLGFCSQTGSTPRALLAKMRLTKSPLYKAGQVLADDTDCELCKMLVTEIQTMEKDNKTQAEIEDFIKTKICVRLGALRGACEESVDTYGPEIFQLLAQELDPDTVCQSLGLCTAGALVNAIQPVLILPQSPVQPKSPVQAKPVKASAQCILCEFVMNQLSTMLKQNATQVEIKTALDKVCSFLPSTISQECQDFVDTYAPAIFAILSQELNPQVVCSTLGLCRSEKVVDLPHVESPEFCAVCETLMQYVDSLLTQNSTVQEIEGLLEKVCNFLPKNYRTQCDDIVEQYGPAIIEMLSQYADPKEVCTVLGLCSNTVKEVPMEKIVPSKANLLGSNECTYGPAFWCASRENAEKCQAVPHCKKHVWKN